MKTVIRNSYTPKVGDYCETIVVDKESQDAYIFDCDGIFTPMPQPVDVEDILRRAAEYTDETVAPLEEKLDTIEEGAQVNVIETITQNGQPLTVTDKTVNVTVPTKTSDLENDGSDGTDTYVESSTLDDYYTKTETDTQIGYETDAREIADSGLQEQIDAIVASSDVVDIVGTYAALQAYDTSKLSDNDIIKVLTDETRDDATTYYRWTNSTWTYIGAEGPFYTKAETDAIFTPMTRTINNKALTTDITLTAQDVGALPDSTVIPTVNDATLTIQKNGTTVGTFTANSASNQTANITVPVDTSDLNNDGDGQSPFATEDYVDLNGGKIDTIEVNGAAQPIVNKTVDITVPTKTSDLTNDGDGNSTYVETDDLGAAAFSNQYADLDGLPTIPTVNDATLTIQKNGANVATFTANSSTNQTANITVPTDTADLTNGAGFITSSALSNYYTKGETYSQGEVNNLINSLSIPTKTSDLTNDSGFISEDDLYSEVCGSGTTITFQDSPEAPLSDFKLNGATSQNGTPTPDAPVPVKVVTGENVVKICGKNLVDISNFKSGSYSSVTGEYIAYGSRACTIDKIPVKPSSTYVVDNHCTNGYTIKNLVDAYKADGIFISRLLNNGSNGATFTTTADTAFINFTLSETSDAMRWNDYQTDFANGTIQPQIELGSTATTYEPYQGQSYEVNLGKNLFDKDGASSVVNAYFDSSSVHTGDSFRTAYIECEPNSTYTVSKIQSSRFAVGTTATQPANGVAISGFTQNNTATNITITTGAGAKYLCVFCYHAAYDTLTPQEILASLQIEKGSQATSYAAYFTPIELCKLGDYQDSIYKSGGKWYVRKEVGKEILSSSNNWVVRGDATVSDCTVFRNLDYVAGLFATNSVVYSSHFIYATSYSNGVIRTVNANEYGLTPVVPNSLTGIESGDSISVKATKFKTWLDNNTVLVYYISLTPTDTEITNAALVAQLEAILSQGYTYAGTNNITTIIAAGNAQGELEICYTKTILPIATETSLGMVRIGSGLSITENGVLSAIGGGGGSTDWSDITNKPTDVSYWTNDAGYITSAAIPTNVSSFTNDAGYITSAAIPTNVSAFTNDAGYITNSALGNYYTKSQTYSQQEVNALINTIAVPTKTSDLTNDGADGTSTYVETDELGAAAFSNSFNDLTDQPTIGNATITIQKNGASAGTFTTNATANKSINITVPTKTSDITNDSGFITGIPTASASTLGGIKVGNNLSIDANGVLSADAQPITIDSALSTSSPNPVQNSVITAALSNKADSSSIGDATLTIQKNGTNVQTFTANSSSNKVANIQVPNLRTSSTDPGEGSTLAADTFLGIYDIAPEDVDGSRLINNTVTWAKIAQATMPKAEIALLSATDGSFTATTKGVLIVNEQFQTNAANTDSRAQLSFSGASGATVTPRASQRGAQYARNHIFGLALVDAGDTVTWTVSYTNSSLPSFGADGGFSLFIPCNW